MLWQGDTFERWEEAVGWRNPVCGVAVVDEVIRWSTRAQRRE